MSIAVCHIRAEPVYRREAFLSGLKRAGYNVVERGTPASKADMLVIWNRYGRFEAMADQWEKDGGTVLVAENGYIGKDELARQYYALAVHGHNGSGWWPIGDEDRFSKLGIDVKPWQDSPAGYALICGQRGIGSRMMASPSNWHINAQRHMAKLGPTKIRLHPGNRPAVTHLEDDLSGARCCVIWSSASGVKALTLGVPVQYDAPHWVCDIGALKLRGEAASITHREAALQKMAYAQWSVAELESGLPFVNIRDTLGEAKW